MGKINVARVILGGLVAGLIINLSEFVLNTYVVAAESAAIMERLGLPPIGTTQVVYFVLLTFVLGIVMIFLYAGIRPRFGAGATTAIIAAVIIWLVVMMGAISDAIIGVAPASLIAIAAIWSLVETVIAAVVGAWLYKERA